MLALTSPLAEALEAVRAENPETDVFTADRVYTAADLRHLGLTKRQILAAVSRGELRAVRRGVYVLAECPDDAVTAASALGRIACVSVLAALGVFVLTATQAHIHFERGAWKHAPATRTQIWHWRPLARAPHPRATKVDVFDALVQSTICQAPRAAIATLDSALHLGLLREDDLDELFGRVPPSRRVLRGLLDGQAESGPETLVRLMALSLGFSVELQVVVDGIGRVDMVLDGWLVVECDSKEHHSGWDSQKKDRRRDLALAARGMSSLRPVAEDIMYHPELVVSALRGLRDAHLAAA